MAILVFIFFLLGFIVTGAGFRRSYKGCLRDIEREREEGFRVMVVGYGIVGGCWQGASDIIWYE